MAAIHQISSDIAEISTAPLPPTQAQVVAALAKGQTITAAAARAGIHRTTIHHWLRTEPDFKTAVETAQRDYVSSLSDEMRELSALALASLRSLLEDPATPPSIRLKAALAVLQRENLPNKTWSLPKPETLAESEAAGQKPAPAPEPIQHPTSDIQHPPFPRSAPCPCGSGLKYKRCCGAGAPGVLGPRDALYASRAA